MKNTSWSVCKNCLGRGTKSRKLSKKVRLQFESALSQNHSLSDAVPPIARPKGHLQICPHCEGSGLVSCQDKRVVVNPKFPHVAIIGAGIAGVALAVACQHRGIPFSLFERDSNFDIRRQGYGLTLQQASRALKGLGIMKLKDGIISTRHVVHTVQGQVIGEWGTRRWCDGAINRIPKRSNIHIARQALRQELLQQLSVENTINWGHQLISYTKNTDNSLELEFSVNGLVKTVTTNLIVAADGIRSTVRRQLLGDTVKPLRYLNCIVILGICSLDDIHEHDTDLLDGSTVFQTANGHERIYMMPYDASNVMWQLSFPMDESEAKKLSMAGAEALKEEAVRRTNWHNPIPQIIRATASKYVSGYPVYDRELLSTELATCNQAVTLIGDAAHPMSPFKGQGANQAILDALSLARSIYNHYHYAGWDGESLREDILNDFESEMLSRSSVKVKDSAEAADFLHSAAVFEGGDQPRRRL